MEPKRQQVLACGCGTEYDWAQDHIRVKTTAALTSGRVTVVEDTLKPGFHLARHHHRQMTEIFYVLEGAVTFKFDDETVIVKPGDTVNVPPGIWHDVSCPDGGRLITIFAPGGFDQYLAEMAVMTEAQFADEASMATLAEKYDIWMRE